MAVIHCSKCNQLISDMIDACPHCSCPISKEHEISASKQISEPVNPNLDKTNDTTIEVVYNGVRKELKSGESYTINIPMQNQNISSNSGCYIATCIYGSYDCPQVWALRRYRDNRLAKSRCGRAFIRAYYAISPTLVKWFGNTKCFKLMWKPLLDKIVIKLKINGLEDTPYQDKYC